MTKKIYIPIFALMAMASMQSCSSKKDNPDEPVNPVVPTGVEVGIASTSIETKAATLEFGENAKMNIFAKTYNRIDAPNIVDGVIATLSGGKWTMEPKVYINESQKNAFVYAVSPYDPSYIDAANIPVDLNRQVDLMYSGAYQPASLTSPNVKLNMKHALALLSFNIVPVNYSGAGNVTSISIEGDIIYSQAKMDVSNGKITPTSLGKVENKVDSKLQTGGFTSNIPGLWAINFNTKTGTVNFTATIDGKNFTAAIPEVEVTTGWQYIFRLALTDNGLEFDPSKTETISLNVTTDEKQNFVGYGNLIVVSSGNWLNSPVIEGDAVFGTLTTPSGHSAYDGSQRVEDLKTGDKVSIESWNSSGFKLETLDGVQTIDITAYE